MSILREIQQSLMQDDSRIGSILLKFRYLASRLGGGLLEDWIKYESEGYSKDIEVPEYRNIRVIYTASFSGPYGSRMDNVSIPSYLIKKYAGRSWAQYEMRQSVSAIDDLLSKDNQSGSLELPSSDLILLLNGKLYPDYSCYSVRGIIPTNALTEIQNVVRTKLLELTLKIENSLPDSVNIVIGPATQNIENDREVVTQITNQVINGNYTNISNSGNNAQITVSINKGDSVSFEKALIDGGIERDDAKELTKIVASEAGGSKEEPFGQKAKKWIVENIGKAVGGTWSAGLSVASKVLTEAALKYYGLG